MLRLPQTLTCAALLTLGLTGQSQAGFLDFLFGNQQQLGYQRPVYVPAYAPPPQSRLRDPDRIPRAPLTIDSDAQNISREANLANIRRLEAVAKSEGVRAAFLKDQTVRPGDILVTAQGLAVYERGRDGAEIRPLAASRYKNRADLQALQKISRLAASNTDAIADETVADNRVTRRSAAKIVTAER